MSDSIKKTLTPTISERKVHTATAKSVVGSSTPNNKGVDAPTGRIFLRSPFMVGHAVGLTPTVPLFGSTNSVWSATLISTRLWQFLKKTKETYMSQTEKITALVRSTFNEPVEGELSITFNQWDYGKDLVINVDDSPVLAIPVEQTKQLSNLLRAVL